MTALLALNGRRVATQKMDPTSSSKSKFKKKSATHRRDEGLYVCRLHTLHLFLECWPTRYLANVFKADVGPIWRMRKSDQAVLVCPGSPLLSGGGRSRSQISHLSPTDPAYRPSSTSEPSTLGFVSTHRGCVCAKEGRSEHRFPDVAPEFCSHRNFRISSAVPAVRH